MLVVSLIPAVNTILAVYMILAGYTIPVVNTTLAVNAILAV